MAKDRSISYAEAAERLSWQAKAEGLHEVLSSDAQAAFAGLWVDPQDGDRVKIAVKSGASAQDRAPIEAELTRRGLAGAADQIGVRRSLTELKRMAETLQAEARSSDDGGRPTGVAISERNNRIELTLPSQPSDKQKAFANEARANGRAHVKLENVVFQRQACIYYPTTLGISCDNPTRGGTLLRTSEGGDCTYGFLVKSKSDGKLFLTTAGHCFDGLGVGVYGYYSQQGTKQYGNLHRKYNATNGDMAIATIASTFGPQGRIIVNSSGDTVRDESYYIASDARPRNGWRVCITGGYSTNTDCGTIADESFYDANTAQWFARANYCNMFGGDSGAPVYAGHTAYGLHTGAASECDNILTTVDFVEPTLGVDVVYW